MYRNSTTIIQDSGVTGRGQSAPQDLWPGNFLLTYREKRGKEKKEKGWNWEEKKENNCKREGGKLEMEVGKVILRWGPFFFFFFFFFHFWKWLKFVLGLQKWEFSTRKKHFTPGKIREKMTLPPQKNMPVTPLIQDSIYLSPGKTNKQKNKTKKNLTFSMLLTCLEDWHFY